MGTRKYFQPIVLPGTNQFLNNNSVYISRFCLSYLFYIYHSAPWHQRKLTSWSWRKSKELMLEKRTTGRQAWQRVKCTRIQHRQNQRRAIKPTEKYIYKDYHRNITEMIDECNILSALDEGLYTMSETIATILGTLKAHKMNFNSLLKATTQIEQMGIYQKRYTNSTTS